MDNTFRKLKANEIEARIAQVNKGGAMLLLYKDARVDQNILDETFGIYGWQREHQLIGDRLYCTVSVRNTDTGEWIRKQDVGTESYTEKEKGQASDSFKRACFNLGIGRELYTAPDIFFPKDKLSSYKAEGDKCTCYDKFKVRDVTYNADGAISSVTIDCLNYGKVYSSMVFSNEKVAEMPKSSPVKGEKKAPAKTPAPTAASEPVKAAEAPLSDVLSDDEVITIGNCRGKKFGEVKDTPQFASFLNWVKSSSSKYDRPDQQRQFDIFKKMSQQKGA